MTDGDRRDAWNSRYSGTDLVWGAEPNVFLQRELWKVAPRGRALDVACGEGRNAAWLAGRGWHVTGVDYSEAAIGRARALAAERGVELELLCEDVTRWQPDPQVFALVVILYLQLPAEDLRRVLGHVQRTLAPGGELLMIGHARVNLNEGAGGPRDPEVLWEPSEIEAELVGLGLDVSRSQLLRRPVEGQGEAIDALLSARAGGERRESGA